MGSTVTEDEKYLFAEQWIYESLRDLDHLSIAEALQEDHDIDDGGETASGILDIISEASVEVSWK